MDSSITPSTPSLSLPGSVVYWTSYLQGMQRVVAFTTDFSVFNNLLKVKDFLLYTESVCLDVTLSIICWLYTLAYAR